MYKTREFVCPNEKCIEEGISVEHFVRDEEMESLKCPMCNVNLKFVLSAPFGWLKGTRNPVRG